MEALAAFGFTPADLPDMDVGLFPENWHSFMLFEAMSTQWRTGPIGASGLDYTAMPVVLRSLGLHTGERQQLFHDMRVMEAEALAVMAEARAAVE